MPFSKRSTRGLRGVIRRKSGRRFDTMPYGSSTRRGSGSRDFLNQDRAELPIRRFLTVVFLFLVSGAWHGSVAAQTGALGHSPAELVRKYFALDQKGARLDSLSFEALAPYTAWREEPAWGRVLVIRGFTVPDHYSKWEIVDRLEVVVPVTFQVLGAVYLDTASFMPEPGTEEIRVRLKAVNSRWKIVEPVLPPHVGQKRMINFVREAWVKETDPTKRDRLAALQEELRKAK